MFLGFVLVRSAVKTVVSLNYHHTIYTKTSFIKYCYLLFISTYLRQACTWGQRVGVGHSLLRAQGDVVVCLLILHRWSVHRRGSNPSFCLALLQRNEQKRNTFQGNLETIVSCNNGKRVYEQNNIHLTQKITYKYMGNQTSVIDIGQGLVDFIGN